MHPLLLDAQHHDHIGVGHRFVDRMRHAHAQPLDAPRHERCRPAHPHLGSKAREQPRVRSQHAAMQQIADDGDFERVEALLVLANGEGVEQRLSRVLVHAVAGVDDARFADARQQMTRARGRVAKNDHVRLHRLDVHRRIRERFAF